MNRATLNELACKSIGRGGLTSTLRSNRNADSETRCETDGFGFATTALPMVVVTHTGQAASAIANGAAAR